MARREAKIAAISCSHAPMQPEQSRRWILDTLAGIEGLTHFGHLGDVFEAAAASVHANEFDHDLEDEFEQAAGFLASIREVVGPDCIRWINTGNHDDNLVARDPRRVPKALRGLTDWTRHPVHGEEFRRWSWLPYEKSARAIMRVGQVHFWHGFDAGQSSDELEGLQMIALSGWIPHSLAVRGHTHRPVPPTQARRTAKIPLPYWYANVGTAGPLQPDWAKRKDTSQWNTAILVVDAVWDKPSRLTGKCWDAHLIRMP
jgi:predicted phosphodiesterase